MERVREGGRRLTQLCGQGVAVGEVPNTFKLLQIHLKYTLMNSEKIRGLSITAGVG